VDASASTDSEGKSVPAGVGDPLYDIKFVEDEFDLWMASVISRDWNKVAREAESQAQKLENMLSKRLTGLGIGEAHIVKALEDTGLRSKKATLWNEEDIFDFCKKVRSRAKPIVIAANKSDLPTAETIMIKLKDLGLDVIPCIAEAEILLRRATKKGFLHYLPGDNSFTIKSGVVLNEQQKKALDAIHSLIAKYGSTGVQEVINLACFKLLKLIVVYPVQDEMKLMDKRGNVLPDAYLLPEGSTAKDLAVTIHADIGKGFLHAIDARSKQRLGAEHKLKNNDVIKIVSARSNG
jgi:ribosome-binding ATPase YchF (GTP1/OBG family)